MNSNNLEASDNNTSDKNVIVIILLLSAAVLGFLIWLIYFKAGSAPEGGTWINMLPAMNAFLNTLTSLFLIVGLTFIKQNNIEWHKRFMYAATITSALFLVGYIAYHNFHGDTKFVATGTIRPVYFGILISHILLSAIQVPLILSTLYFALTKKYVKHKKVAKITFPIWLYVSITGVVIFIFLKFFNS
jgi:putative membrane protein